MADVLFRAPDGTVPFDFTGRLSFSWPATAQPVQFGDAGIVRGALFPVGYGLSYGRHPDLPRLGEDARLTADQRMEGTLYQGAHVTAPWSIFLVDDLASVRLTTSQQTSPAGFLLVEQSPQGLVAQWSAGHRAFLEVFGRSSDLQMPATEGLALVLDYRVLQAPSEAVRLGMLCTSPYVRHPPEPDAATAEADRRATQCKVAQGAFIDISAALAQARAPGWHQLVLPLKCLTRLGADLTNVDTPLVLGTAGSLELSIKAMRLQRSAAERCDGAERSP